eukprot:1736146-Alexandrium_andersonii.AAC.1
MSVFSDLDGLRGSPVEPIWDLQAVRREGDWVVAIADREGVRLKTRCCSCGAEQEPARGVPRH